MANTRETMGEQACFDALVGGTLTSFEDDGVTKVCSRCFTGSALRDIKLSQCTTINSYGFDHCLDLEVVDILGTGYIYDYAFEGDAKLQHLVMRGSSKSTLFGSSVFSHTPIVRGEGAVYVDSSLLASYKADTNWSKYFITTLDKYPLSEFSTIEDDWATIISKAEAGTASESYSIGDTKLIDLGAEGKVYAQIVAFDADTLASDSTKTAGITFITKGLLNTKKRMNPFGTGAQGTGGNGGWEYSEMRSYLSGTVLALFPSSLQTAIKSVIKYSSNIVPGESDYTKDGCVTEDKLWIPSHREVFNVTTYETQGPSYSSVLGSSLIKYNQVGTTSYWWLRSVISSYNFLNITSSGGVSNSASTSTSNGIAIGFCI